MHVDIIIDDLNELNIPSPTPLKQDLQSNQNQYPLRSSQQINNENNQTENQSMILSFSNIDTPDNLNPSQQMKEAESKK